eukprot:2360232-Pleurochrysis_carterae.AAC.1
MDTRIGGRGRRQGVAVGGGEVAERRFDAVFAAPLCALFSMASAEKLRSREEPERIEPVPRCSRRYLAKYNALAHFTADRVRAAHAAGAAWMVEQHPADCDDERGAA